jgi:hypothetical protein
MFANIKIRQDGDMSLVDLDSQSARHLAQELLYLAEEAEDHGFAQQTTVFSPASQMEKYGSKVSHVTVRPKNEEDYCIDMEIDNAMHRTSRYGKDKVHQRRCNCSCGDRS